MLNKYYNKGIVGLNYVSLTYGLIAMKHGHTSLIVDDERLPFSNKWYLNIGYLERSILIRIGEKYDINPLKNLDNYLEDKNTVLCLNKIIIELVDSPFSNIKEIGRKIPECFSDVYLNKLNLISPDVFDADFFEFLDQVSESAFEKIESNNIKDLFNAHKGLEFTAVMESFISFFEKNTDITKQIHYILQVMYQTVFSSAHLKIESEYLLMSLLSPRFEVNEAKLKEDLLFDYRKTGGDIKVTSIKDWGIEDKKLKYILLYSIDGLIKLDKCHFFSQVTHHLPFDVLSAKTQFKSIKLECMLDHKFVSLYEGKRIIFSNRSRMGSDFPYWEISIDDTGLLTGLYSYADYTGTKPSFYYHHAVEDIYISLKAMLPGLLKADWVSRVKLEQGEDNWFEFSASEKSTLYPGKNQNFEHVFDKDDGSVIDSLYQCGPNRSKSLGFYSYLLDVFS
jgi:hypothetical protein